MSTLDWQTEVLRMIIGQGPTVVTMAVMLWILTTAIKDFVKVEIPKHLASIRSGYEEIIRKNAADNALRDQIHSESLKSQQQTFLSSLELLRNVVELKVVKEDKEESPQGVDHA